MFDAINLNDAGGQGWQVSPGRCGLSRRANILNHERVDHIFGGHGHRWRDRELPPGVTMELFLRQVMDGNCACSEVRLLPDAPGSFTPSAYCQARARLPVAGGWEVVRGVTGELENWEERGARWRGHRTFHVDGTGFSMPDTPELQEAFGQPGMQGEGCGFPVAHLLTLFDAQTGLVLEAHPAPLRTHDLRHIGFIHEHLSAGDVLIGDKAFGSWAHLAMLGAAGAHGLFPLHQRRQPSVGALPAGHAPATGGRFDRIERWPKPKSVPAWMSPEEYAKLPAEITVRVVRRQASRGRGLRAVEVFTICSVVCRLLAMTFSFADPPQRLTLGLDRASGERSLRRCLSSETLKTDTTGTMSLCCDIRASAACLSRIKRPKANRSPILRADLKLTIRGRPSAPAFNKLGQPGSVSTPH
jgi:hypothetical protein